MVDSKNTSNVEVLGPRSVGWYLSNLKSTGYTQFDISIHETISHLVTAFVLMIEKFSSRADPATCNGSLWLQLKPLIQSIERLTVGDFWPGQEEGTQY